MSSVTKFIGYDHRVKVVKYRIHHCTQDALLTIAVSLCRFIDWFITIRERTFKNNVLSFELTLFLHNVRMRSY